MQMLCEFGSIGSITRVGFALARNLRNRDEELSSKYVAETFCPITIGAKNLNKIEDLCSEK